MDPNDTGGQVAPADILKVAVERIVQADTRGKLHIYLLQDATTSDVHLRERFQATYLKWKQMIEDALRSVYGGISLTSMFRRR